MSETDFDFDVLERELRSNDTRPVFIHFLGDEGEGTDLPFTVSATYLASVHTVLEGWEDERQEEDGPATYRISLQDVGTRNSLLEAPTVEFKVTCWIYMSLLAEVSLNHVRRINASF